MKKDSPMYALGLYGAVGIQLAVSVVAGLVAGNYFDNKIGSGPWLAIVGTVLGVVAGMWNLIRIMKYNERDSDGSEKN